MNKVLIICGPTATGKTSLALSLAKKFKGELISADSRQIYKGMDIGTGKDIPLEFKHEISSLRFQDSLIGYYTNGTTRIWGLDIVSPNEEFSVSHYSQYADMVIKDIVKRDKLPILVGGTGLYIHSVVDGIETSSVPADARFRAEVNSLSPEELFEMLERDDKDKAHSLNDSDKHNPRRLIRALEIAKYQREHMQRNFERAAKYNSLFVGLGLSKQELEKRIVKRVNFRLEQGFEHEVQVLREHGLLKFVPQETLGYKQWISFINKKITKVDAVQMWINAERQYAKRQMTWFKKDKRITWFDISWKNYEKKVEDLVREWYKIEQESYRPGE